MNGAANVCPLLKLIVGAQDLRVCRRDKLEESGRV
jgi:hypothetical protein